MLRRICDADDLAAETALRFDRCVASAGVTASSNAELDAFVNRIANSIFVDKLRELNRRKRLNDARFASMPRERLAHDEEPVEKVGRSEQVDRIVESVTDVRDRRILSLWLRDITLAEIARRLDLPTSLVKKRWWRLCAHLRSRPEKAE